MRDYGLLLLRLVVGAGLIMHGYPLIAGGMEEFAASLGSMGVPIPEISAWAAALSEAVGGLFLILGLITRIAALLPSIALIVAVALVHAKDTVPQGQWISDGMERAVLYLAATLCLLLVGAGSVSIDYILFHGEQRD